MPRLLTVQETAEILRTTPNTVYRWCRAGKLPAIKVGKEWRIEEDIWQEATTARLPQDRTELLWDKLLGSEHLMVITSSPEEVYQLETEFFTRATELGHSIFKGCWWQDGNEVEQKLQYGGIAVRELKESGFLTIANLQQLWDQFGVDGPIQAWTQELERVESNFGTRLWASGSPHLGGGDPIKLVDFEKKLNASLKNRNLLGICPYCLNDMQQLGDVIELMAHHTGTVFYSNGKAILLRQ